MSPYNMQSFNKGVANVRGDKNGKKTLKRCKILEMVKMKQLTQVKAAKLLGITKRQMIRS